MTPEQREFVASDEFRNRLTHALIEAEEAKIDPRFWTDELDDDYEPPGIGCGDAKMLIEFMLK